MQTASVMGMVVLVLAWLLLGWKLTPAGRARAVWLAVGCLALLVRFVATLLILGNHGDTAGTDGLIYHKVAISVMEQLRRGVPIWRVSHSYTWYTLVLGTQYALTGANRFLGCFMNAFYAVAAAQVLLRVGLQLGFSMKKAILVAGGWLFMPSLVIWTADTRKEGLTMLLAMLLWQAVALVVKPRRPLWLHGLLPVLGACLLLWVSTVLRVYMLFPLGFGMLASLILRWGQTRRRAFLVFALLVLALMVLLGAATVLPQVDGNHALGVERTEGGDEDLSAEYRSVLRMILERDLPAAVNGFFTEPHPRKIADITDLQGHPLAVAAVLVEMLIWYAVMVTALLGMMDATLRLDAFLVGLIVFILIYSGVNILIAENISDTYYRYRALVIAPVMLFADPLPMLRLFGRGRLAAGDGQREG